MTGVASPPRTGRRLGIATVAVVSALQLLTIAAQVGAPLQPLVSVLFVLTCPGFFALDMVRPADLSARILIGVTISIGLNLLVFAVLAIASALWLAIGLLSALAVAAVLLRGRLGQTTTQLRMPTNATDRGSPPAQPRRTADTSLRSDQQPAKTQPPTEAPRTAAEPRPREKATRAPMTPTPEPAVPANVVEPAAEPLLPVVPAEVVESAPQPSEPVPSAELVEPAPGPPPRTADSAIDDVRAPVLEPPAPIAEPVAEDPVAEELGAEEPVVPTVGVLADQAAASASPSTAAPPSPPVPRPPARTSRPEPVSSEPVSAAKATSAPERAVPSPPSPERPQSGRFGLKVNVNTAPAEGIASLPGIGMAIAERIVAHRAEHGTFADVGDLLDVSGIGKRKLAGFVHLVVMEDEET